MAGQEKEDLTGKKAEAVTAEQGRSQAESAATANRLRVKEDPQELQDIREAGKAADHMTRKKEDLQRVQRENMAEQEKEDLTGKKAEAVTAGPDRSQAESGASASQGKAKENFPALQGLREVREGKVQMI